MNEEIIVQTREMNKHKQAETNNTISEIHEHETTQYNFSVSVEQMIKNSLTCPGKTPDTGVEPPE